MERRPAECVDVRVGRGLGERDLARGRAGGERLGHVAGPGGDPRRGRAAGTRRPGTCRDTRGVERLSSSSSVKPRSHASARSPTVVPMQGQTTPSVGGAAGAGSSAAARRRRSPDVAGHPGEDVARRQAEAEDHGVGRRGGLGRRSVVRRHDRADPAGGVAFESDRRPSTRAGRRRGAAFRPRRPSQIDAGGVQPLRRARGQEPGSSLPGQTGWISAAPVATTISCGVDVEHPGRRPRRRWSARRRCRRPRRRAARRGPGRLPGRLRVGGRAAGRPIPADDRDVRPRRAGPRSPAGGVAGGRTPTTGSGGGRRPDAARRPGRAAPRSGTSARTRCRRLRRGSSRSRRPGRASRRAPAPRPARRIAIATESPGSNATGRPSTTIRPADSSSAGAAGRSVTGASACLGVEQRLWLDPRRPPPPDDLDLETRRRPGRPASAELGRARSRGRARRH